MGIPDPEFPDDVRDALVERPAVTEAWQALRIDRQRELLALIEVAEGPDDRAARIAHTVEALLS